MESNFQTLNSDFEYIFKSPTEIHESSRFRLFDLPPELWIRICELAVTKPYEINTTRAKKREQQIQIVRQPAISRTCRLLRQEALPIFYESNHFVAYHWAGVACIRKWLVTIGHANLRSLGTLTFHCRCDPDFWVKKFEKIGISTKVTVAADQSRATGSFRTLIVSFL